MNGKRRANALVQFLVLIPLLLTAIASANCGLDFCPMRYVTKKNQAVSASLRHHAFDLPEGSGSYLETSLRYDYLGIANLALSANLPVERLAVDGSSSRLGIANPMLAGVYYLHFAPMQMLYFGLQLELPLGDADHGMASDHFMAVPNLHWENSWGWGFAKLGAGMSQAFHMGHVEHDEDAPAPPLYVHPHEDREALYRLGFGFNFSEADALVEVYFSGAYALVDELEHGSAKGHLLEGLSVEYTLSPQLSLNPMIESAIDAHHRFNWMAGMAVRTRF